MKVVLFCGGLGTRLREESEAGPKPLVNIGSRPILWYLMKYYAHFGHTEFILCLGYRGDAIRQYFLNYTPFLVEDFVLDRGERRLYASSSDVPDWTIHFIDTGLHANVGQRLMAVRRLVEDEDTFLANYSDCLTDLPLDTYVDTVRRAGCVAGFAAVRPYGSFHSVYQNGQGVVTSIRPVSETDNWINGGFMVLTPTIFDYMQPEDELVEAPFSRLIERQKLYAYKYEGFWKAMDTYKDKLAFDQMYGSGIRPWEVWRK